MSREDEIMVRDAEDAGRAIRAARKQNGLTQQQFADLAVVGVRFLSELERGKATAELGLALQVIQDAGYDVVLRRRGARAPIDRGDE